MRRKTWECHEVKRKEQTIEDKEMQERLENVWEVLQSLNRQPTVSTAKEVTISPRVKGSESKRSAS